MMWVQELEELVKMNKGSIRPDQLVEWAKEHPESDLHSRFEWDDEKAGYSYRLIQARHLIAVVKIEIRPSEEVRAYVSLKNDRGKDGYRPLTSVLANHTQREALLSEALGELTRIRMKYAMLTELSSVWAEIAKVELEAEQAA